MSKQPTPKADALRAMREARARQKMPLGRSTNADLTKAMEIASARAEVSADKAAAKRAARKNARD